MRCLGVFFLTNSSVERVFPAACVRGGGLQGGVRLPCSVPCVCVRGLQGGIGSASALIPLLSDMGSPALPVGISVCTLGMPMPIAHSQKISQRWYSV